MKFLFDLFPVLLFFAAFKLEGIYFATAVAIGATFLQIGILAALRKRIGPMLWISLAIIVVFGGATLVLRNETFIKWKPTVLYWMFSAVLAGSALLFRKNLIRSMLAAQFKVPDPVWARLNWSWVVFFVFLGAANLLVAFTFNFSTAEWVDFKTFGVSGLLFLFFVGQGVYLFRHIEEEKPAETKP